MVGITLNSLKSWDQSQLLQPSPLSPTAPTGPNFPKSPNYCPNYPIISTVAIIPITITMLVLSSIMLASQILHSNLLGQARFLQVERTTWVFEVCLSLFICSGFFLSFMTFAFVDIWPPWGFLWSRFQGSSQHVYASTRCITRVRKPILGALGTPQRGFPCCPFC